MEIIDYLRIAKRRWWILVLVPLLAAGAFAAVTFGGPATFSSTATVFSGTMVGADGSPFSGTQGGSQFVAAFQAAAQNPKTQMAVQSATGVGPNGQDDGLTIAPVGTSSDLTVTFVGANREAVAKVAAETSRQSIDLMFAARTASATASRQQAEATATAANGAVAALSTKYGMADAPRAYQASLNQVASLQQQQANLRATGNSIGAAALDAPIAAANATLASFVPILAQYNNLASIQSAANSDLTQAQADWRHATALQAAATAPGVVVVSETTPVNKLTAAAPLLAAIFGAGLFLAVVLIFLLEVIQRMRAAGRETDAARAGSTVPPGEHGDPAARVSSRAETKKLTPAQGDVSEELVATRRTP